MRYWAIGLAIVGAGMAGLIIGCESDSPPEESAEYDPEVDAPPTNLAVSEDQNLLCDQALVAARDAKAAAAVAGTSLPPPAATTEPATTEPATTEPVATQPAPTTRPVATQPAPTTQPAATTKPAATQPAPATTAPATAPEVAKVKDVMP